MPQQINLCTPILLTQKRYFSAQTMVQSLAIFAILGGSLLAYSVWTLNVASEGFKKTLSLQSRELESLESAIKQGKAGVGSAESVLTQELQGLRTELLQREGLLAELQQGLYRPGWGHSARLQLVAQSIPPQVWVTEVKADQAALEVSGFTLEPAALNQWVLKLAASPLLKDQQLATVKVENVSTAMVKVLPTASSAKPGSTRPMWSFSLVSAVATPLAVAGGKP